MNDIDNFEGFVESEEDSPMYSEYHKLGVQQVSTELKLRSKKYIESIAEIYLKASDLIPSKFKEMHLEIEADSFVAMWKNVIYSSHMLDTLMIQLDNGGYMNSEIFGMVREQQKASNFLTLEFAKYKATLPQLFRALNEDISSFNAMEVEEVSVGENKAIEGATRVRDSAQYLKDLRDRVLEAQKRNSKPVEQIDNRDMDNREDVEVIEDENFSTYD